MGLYAAPYRLTNVERTSANNIGQSQNDPYWEHLFLQLSNIYLSRDIKAVSEFYGQRSCFIFLRPEFFIEYNQLIN
jgi:hypothetical protein